MEEDIIDKKKMEEDIIDALEKTGFPFEIKVRRVLRESKIETCQTRYFEKHADGEISRDLDVFGYIEKKKIEKNIMYKNNLKNKIEANLQLLLIGQVKKWDDHKICFYEVDEKTEKYDISFPNFLNKCIYSDNFAGGYINFYNFVKEFGYISLSKEICILEPTKNTKIKGYKANGNELVYKTSNELAYACEWFHRRSINYLDDAFHIGFLINGCFPVIFTEAEIFKISGDVNLALEKIDRFMYMVACADLDKVPLTTRKYHMNETYYLPILISNFDGIISSIDMIKKIGENIYKEFENISEEDISQEFEEHKRFR